MVSKLASVLKGLLGPKVSTASEKKAEPTVEHKGYGIRPASFQDGAHWVSACWITKEFPDGVKEHHFVRSDFLPSRDAANEFVVTKAKRVIDDLGDHIFDGG